jgi:hypothetical protein
MRSLSALLAVITIVMLQNSYAANDVRVWEGGPVIATNGDSQPKAVVIRIGPKGEMQMLESAEELANDSATRERLEKAEFRNIGNVANYTPMLKTDAESAWDDAGAVSSWGWGWSWWGACGWYGCGWNYHVVRYRRPICGWYSCFWW